jgi:GLPGLI family protein
MKKLKLTAIMALFSMAIASAQEFRGLAVYESQITLPEEATKIESEEIDEEMGKAIDEAIKGAMHKTYTLNFDKNASLYQEEKKLAQPTPGLSISIMVGEEGVEYKNIKEKRKVTETTLFDKEFLIVDSLQKYDWKLEKETKKIGNYTCYKATAVIKPTEPKDDVKAKDKAILLADKPKEMKITAWYTPEIPIGHGPSGYWGLPGLILEANDGITTLLCSKIVLNAKDKTEIKAPKKGKKVTQQEYDKVAEEKRKEFELQDGDGDGNVKIIKMG